MTFGLRGALCALPLLSLLLTACDTGGLGTPEDSPFAPAADPKGVAEDGLVVGHRLMAAGEYELALKAFTRAAADRGMTAEVLGAIGTANIGLGRLGQAEKLLKDAIDAGETHPELWNNLGVVLMEQGKIAEASQIFRKAYALDNGNSDAIRDNLRLALAKLQKPSYDLPNNNEFKLVRRGGSDYLLQRAE